MHIPRFSRPARLLPMVLWLALCLGLYAQPVQPPESPEPGQPGGGHAVDTPNEKPAAVTDKADNPDKPATPPMGVEDGFEDKFLNTTDKSDTGDQTTRGPGLLRVLSMVFFVGLIIALIYGLAWFLRFVSNRRAAFGGNPAARVLNRLPLTAKHVMVTVRLGSRILVLGLGPEGCSRVAEIDDPDEVEALTADLNASGAGLGGFGKLFRSSLNESSTAQADDEHDEDRAESIDRARSELESIRQTIKQWDRSNK